MRSLLEIMAERHKPKLVVQTRSPLVTRDCDLFQRIANNGGRVQVNMTVTTDDEDIRRTFEELRVQEAQRHRDSHSATPMTKLTSARAILGA